MLTRDRQPLACFQFEDTARPGAAGTIAWLASAGLQPEMLSGDQPGPVSALARGLGIASWRAGQTPGEKIARIRALQADGHQVLMVGDGLNDAPAMSAADASIAPGTAADIGRRAAGFVFLHTGLEAVVAAIRTARMAKRLVLQNFALAALYNAVAIPLAIAGYASPLVAALAMSGSSIVVIANAMRLNWGGREGEARTNSPTKRRTQSVQEKTA